MSVITRKDFLFGEIRFEEGYPFLSDILKSLNYKEDISYQELISDNMFVSVLGNTLIDDEGINILIENSNIVTINAFKEWLVDYILPTIRKKKSQHIVSDVSSNTDCDKLNKAFEKFLDTIPEEDWAIIPVHGFSNNFMYTYMDNGAVIKSKAYKKWIKNFPTHLLNKFNYIDFDKPITACYKYDQLEKFDTPNFSKASSDIIANHFKVDDHNITTQISIKNSEVNSLEEGRIHVYLYNR